MRKVHDSSSESLARSSSQSPEAAACTPAASDLDPLSDVLRSVRLTGALFFLWHVSWPYVTPVPAGRTFAPIILRGAQQIISYHIVTRGSCWGGLIGAPPVRLEAGDILLIPHGDAYVMSSAEQMCFNARPDVDAELGFFRQMAAGELPFVIEDGGGGETSTHLICGFLGCDVRPFNPVLAALPPLVHLRATSDPAGDRLHTLIDYTLVEAQQPRPGGQSVLVRLSELMFVEVVRRCLAELSATSGGWLGALRDPIAGRALMALHRDPASPWTIERLANEADISRSRLAESFTQRVGQPPMQYLTQWRMQLAARVLADTQAKVASVARDVGYESEAAFSRAFKRFVGLSPAQWRQQSRGTPSKSN